MHKLNLLAFSICNIAFLNQAIATNLPSGFQNIYGDTQIKVSENKNNMLIVSNTKNNVLGWKDFSIGKNNKVLFDSNNYLNLVKGPNKSVISGELSATGNVIIVNPNGISLEKGAEMHAGHKLTLSTAKVLDHEIENFKRSGEFISSNKGMGRVTISGKTYVNNIDINAGQIIIRNLEDIQNPDRNALTNQDATHIKLTSSTNRIDIGGRESIDFDNVYKFTNLKGLVDHRGEIAISDSEDFLKISDNLKGNYFLTDDIKLNLKNPLGGSTGFEGKLDGAFNKISFTLDYNSQNTSDLGLFTQIYNAQIKNVMLDNCQISLGNKASNITNIGALAGSIYESKLENIEVNGFKVNAQNPLENINIGALTGKIGISGKNQTSLNNVLVYFDKDTDKSLFNNKNINAGAFAGVADSDFLIKNNVGYQNSNLKAFGKNNTEIEVLELSNIKDQNILKTDKQFTLKGFYDPFFVENFEFKYDKDKNYSYTNLVNTQGFDINEILNVNPDGNDLVSAEGTYTYNLSNKQGKDRNFYFVNENGDAFTGAGSIKITGENKPLPPKPSYPEDSEKPQNPQINIPDSAVYLIAKNSFINERAKCTYCHDLKNKAVKNSYELLPLKLNGNIEIDIENNAFMQMLLNNSLSQNTSKTQNKA